MWLEADRSVKRHSKGLEGRDPDGQGVVGVRTKQAVRELAHVQHTQVAEREEHTITLDQNLQQTCKYKTTRVTASIACRGASGGALAICIQGCIKWRIRGQNEQEKGDLICRPTGMLSWPDHGRGGGGNLKILRGAPSTKKFITMSCCPL